MNDKADIRLAARMKEIQPFHVMALLARARELESQGRSIIHMEIGEPDFVTPQTVIDAGKKAFDEGLTHYTPATGLPELRHAIAQHYHQHYGVDISSHRIIVTPGASGALLLALGVLVNPGDEVLMADPGYPCNRNFVRFMEGRAQGVPVDSSTHYQLTVELLEQNWTDKTAAVMLASPSNPTGTIIADDQLQAIARFVAENNASLIVDEIYHGLVYEGDPMTALAIEGKVFVINSFSKYYTMTGWRLGWLAAPEAYTGELDKLAQNLFLAAPTSSQYAALAAFRDDTIAILEQRREEFRQRRDYLIPALQELGFDIKVKPQGAFYVYADCSHVTNDSYRFAQDLLEQKGVAITPGVDFGEYHANRHVRFAYTTSMEKLMEGIDRIREFL